MSVIDDRVSEIRRVLEACEAEGFDPAVVFFTQYKLGVLQIHPTPSAIDVPIEKASAILARLTDGEQTRNDYPAPASASPFSACKVDDVTVFGRLVEGGAE